MERASGILLHVSSLPNNYGIGSFGKECYDFIDFLKKSGQKYWQVLPLNQTGFGNSPYQSCASNSFNPYFIDLVSLKKEGLITEEELILAEDKSDRIDFGKLYYERYLLLKKAFLRFDTENKDFISFCEKGKFNDYALYMALKEFHGNRPFYEWFKEYKFRDETALKTFENKYKSNVQFWQFIQYIAESQWSKVHAYAIENDVKIIGDMPLYVAYDSVDVWVNPKLFKLDKNLRPTKVAGVPPDYFSALGQLWGNPVYNYKEHETENFKWWTERIKQLNEIFDCIRIDHFRGLDRFFEIPYGNENAVIGKWVQVPYKKLFNSLNKVLKENSVIAEDLGVVDNGVLNLLKFTGYPGMKVLGFAFDGDLNNPHLPYNVKENCVCYTGTHDNAPIMTLLDDFKTEDARKSFFGVLNYCKKQLKVKGGIKNKRDISKLLIELGFASKANLFIVPMTDVLLLGNEYRMNEPSTSSNLNWSVRLDKKMFTDTKAEYLLNLTKKYNR